MQQPVMVMSQNVKREQGRKAQHNNIQAAVTVSEIVRSTLGPRAMLKMILDPMGGIVMTNDGNAILREIEVIHPAAKHMIELARAQDEEIGDGTTSVIVLAGEMLALSEPLIERQIHPIKIVQGFAQALEDAVEIIKESSVKIDTENHEEMTKVVGTCLGTKFSGKYGDFMSSIACTAVKRVTRVDPNHGDLDIDVKRYAKIEKVPGGNVMDSHVLNGVMFNKDITHPKMRRLIENPRILLLDCPLEYKKAESQLNVEIMNEDDWETLIRQEEDFIKDLCKVIIQHKPDVVVTEKGLSDLAQHFFIKKGISCIRRLRKTDNNRIARACGATICSRVNEIKDSDIGTLAKKFEVRKLGDEYFTFIEGMEDATACSILLRGASKDTLNEYERNLHDAMAIARNITLHPAICYGGGAIEMEVAQRMKKRAEKISGVQQSAYRTVADALEIIPRTLTQNCGGKILQEVTKLRAKHSTEGNGSWGIDGKKGVMADMKETGVIEPAEVKLQSVKTAIESACVLLRIDDIVSGITRKEGGGGQGQQMGGGAPDDEE